MRILIVDDHPILRNGVRSLLQTAPNVEVCGEAVDGVDAIEKANQLKPDVIIMDVTMPRMNGLEATREIRRIHPDIEILVLTQHESEEMARQALKAGARGYLVKSTVGYHLIKALEDVSQRKAVIDSAIPALSANAEALEILQRTAAFEQVLRESEERFRTLADTVPALVWMSGTDDMCNFFNKPWLEFRGRTLEQEAGEGWSEGVHPDDLTHCLQTYMSAFESRRPFTMEYRLRRADGMYRWILDNGVTRYTDKGIFAGYIGSCIDITDRKETEQAVTATIAHLQLVTDQMGAAVTRCSRDLRYVWVNPRYAEWIGRSADQIIGHPIVEVLGDEAFARLQPYFRRVLLGDHVAYREEVEFKGIGRRQISAVYTPTMDATGTTDGWIAWVTDVTDRQPGPLGPSTRQEKELLDRPL